MDCPIGVLLPDEQDKHMEKESGYGLSGGFCGKQVEAHRHATVKYADASIVMFQYHCP